MAEYERVKEIFLQARALPANQRAAWLGERCGGHASLRAEVESLLAAERETEDYTAPESSFGLLRGATVAHYRISKPLGMGGMGEVWLAEQREPVHRRVALKLIKWGLNSREVLARFEAERQALALMLHPGIAQFYDAGTTPDGRPYFAMEHVAGLRITDYCDRHRLGLRARLHVFRDVCLAVQHAHQKGIIHRDLKPGNVLVAEVDGRPQPNIIDFGVAKATAQRLTERTIYSELNLLIGTPEDMSPEQADPGPGILEVDTRSDIYSLGAILYELLTGQLPFDGKRLHEVGYGEMLRILREEEPPSLDRRVSGLGGGAAATAQARATDPSTLMRALRGDLDWIVAKALRKEPERRYQSVAELVADLDRHLAGDPVEARPATVRYRTTKFLRRHARGLAATAAAAVVLFALVAFYTFRLAAERDRARLEAARAERVSELLTNLFTGADPYVTGAREPRVRDLVDAGAERIQRELRDQPELQATMLTTIGAIYQRLALYEPAQRLLERAVAIRESHAPGDSSGVALSLFELGVVHAERADFQRAAPLLERALAMRETEYGSGHEAVAEVLNVLGNVRKRLGRLDDAERLHQRALAIRLQRFGEDSVEVAQSRSNLGTLYQLRGRFDAAQSALEEALRGYRTALGPEHAHVANTHNSLGATLGMSGRTAEAVPFFAEALRIRERLFGDVHPHTATTLNNLGFALTQLGRHDAAEPFLKRAMAAYTSLFGERHHEVARCTGSLGLLYLQQKRYHEAEPLLRRSVALWSELRGTTDPEVVGPMDSLVRLLEETGRLAEARALAERALAIRQGAYGPDHPDVVARRKALQ